MTLDQLVGASALTSPRSVTELAYAAGLMDGEGSIMVTFRRSGRAGQRRIYHYLAVALANTDERMPRWLADRWGGPVYSVRQSWGNFRAMYRWQLSAASAAEFLVDVRPYLVVKGEQADVALEFAATMRRVRITEEIHLLRESLRDRMRRLNVRGNAALGMEVSHGI